LCGYDDFAHFLINLNFNNLIKIFPFLGEKEDELDLDPDPRDQIITEPSGFGILVLTDVQCTCIFSKRSK